MASTASPGARALVPPRDLRLRDVDALLGRAPRVEWVVYHLAELTLSVGLVPLSALIVLLGLAWTARTAVAERAFLATAAAAIIWEVVEVGTFASPWGFRIQERYLFNLAPVLLLALVVWLARGLPRPRVLTAFAGVVPLALLLTIPYAKLLTTVVFNSTFALIPLWRLRTALGGVAGPVVLTADRCRGSSACCSRSFRGMWPAGPCPARSSLPRGVLGERLLDDHLAGARLPSRGRAAGRSELGRPRRREERAGGAPLHRQISPTRMSPGRPSSGTGACGASSECTAQDPSIPDVTPRRPRTAASFPICPPARPTSTRATSLAATGAHVVGTQIASSGQLVLWRVQPPLRLRTFSP